MMTLAQPRVRTHKAGAAGVLATQMTRARRVIPPPLHLVMPARTESVPKARHAVSAYTREVGGPIVEVESFVSEAVANSVLHGYPGDDDGLVTVDAQITFDGRLLVRVMDDGVGISPNKGRRGLGFGIALMASHTASLAIERLPGGGTGVFGHFDLPPISRPRDVGRARSEDEPGRVRR